MKAYTVIENGIKKYKIVNQKLNGQGVYYASKDLGIDKSFSSQLSPLQKIGTVRVVNWFAYNFNASSYIKVANCVPSGDKEFQVAFVFKEGISQQGICEIKTNNISFSIETHDTSLYYYVTYNGSTTTYSGTNTLVDGDSCVLKCSFEGAWFKAYLSQNNGSFVQERLIADDNNRLVRGDFILGTNLISDYYFTSIIDLNHTYVKQNNVYLFRGDMPYGLKQFGILSNDYIIEKGPIDYTVVGSPTIENGWLTNTDSNNRVLIKGFDTTKPWEIVIKINIAEDQAILGAGTDTMGAIGIRTSGNAALVFLGSTSDWTFDIANNAEIPIILNVDYYIKILYTGTSYILAYSTNGNDFTVCQTIQNSTPVASLTEIILGHWFGTGSTLNKFSLSASYIKVDGWAWFGSANLIWANPNIYLQGDSNQLIVTDIYPNSNYTLEANIKPIYNSAQYNNCIIDTAGNGSETGRIGFMYRDEDLSSEVAGCLFYNYYPTTDSSWTNYQFNKKYNLKTIKDSENTYFYVNGNLDKTRALETLETSTQPLKFWNYNSKGILYNVKVNDDNRNLVGSFVPVPQGLKIGIFTVPSNGMYDMVEQKFYPNAGTGNFIYGKD